jgi:hypothetical protein
LWNVAIQVYLTAAVLNLKRLAAFCRALRAKAGYRAWGVLREVLRPRDFTRGTPLCACLLTAA